MKTRLWFRNSSTLKAWPLTVLFCVLVLVFTTVFSYTREYKPARVYAATSSTLNFQARLLTSSGNTVPDGFYNIQFNLYTVSSGGSSAWTETRDYDGTDDRVRVVNGYFSVNLGSVTSFPATINWDQEHWLGLTVRGSAQCIFASTCTPADSEMSPRMKLTGVPYAFAAGRALSVQSYDTNAASTNTNAITIQSGNATGATSNSGSLTIDSGTATGAAGTISIGTANTTGITIGRTGITTFLQGTLQISDLDCTTFTNGGALTTDGSGNVSCSNDDGGGGGGTLQDAYNASTSPATIQLSAADDGILIQNPSSGGLDITGGAALKVENLATGNVEGLRIESAGTGNLFTVRDTTATARDVVTIADGGAATFRNQTDSTAAFTIQNAAGTNILNVDSTNSITSVRGINSVATLGSEKVTNGTFTGSSAGWTEGTGWQYGTNNETHTTGNATDLEQNVSAVSGEAYQVKFTISAWTAGCVRPQIGGVNGAYVCANSTNQTQVITATGTGNLKLHADASFAGTIDDISVFKITPSNAVLQVRNSDDSIGLAVRSGGGVTNTFVGLTAGQSNTTGTSNVALGASALQSNLTGTNNTAIGTSALKFNTTGTYNTAIGTSALLNNTSGSVNVAVGVNVLENNTTGSRNIAIGDTALSSNTKGTNNIGLGELALGSNTSGNHNIALGNQALGNNITGSDNVALGEFAGVSLDGGSKNLFFGYSADTNQSNLQNSTAIGTYSYVTQNNSIVLGCINGTNGCTTSTRVGIGNTAPAAVLHVTSSGTDPIFRLTDSTATATDVLNVADGGAITARNQTNSTSAFQIQNAAGTNIFNVDTTNSKIGTINTTAASTNSQVLTIKSGDASGATSDSGNVILDSGTATGTAGSISIGTGAYAHNTTIGNTTSSSALTLQAGTGNITLNGQTVGTGASTATTGNTESTARTNVTTVTIDAAGSFANNDVIFIDNAGQDYYTRIVSGAGTTSLTVSPAVSYDADVTITKYNVQNIGATTTDYATLNNRFFQGYFLGGVVVGAGSTTLSDGNLTSTGELNITGTKVRVKSTVDQADAYQIQRASNGDVVFNADTTNNRVTVGNATASSSADSTLFVVDSASTTNLPTGVNGGIVYDSTTNKFKIYENGAYKTLCNTTDLGCGTGGGGTLQDAYDTTVDATPEIVLTSSQGVLTVRDASSALGTNLFEVQNNAGSTTYFGVSATGISVTGTGTFSGNLVVGNGGTSNSTLQIIGNTSLPTPTGEGHIFYNQTTNQLYIYDGSRWQADRTTATKIVAASDSQNKEKADYVADGTDDEVEINAAITALPASGGIVYLLEGTYTIDDSVDADDRGIEIDKSNVTLTGSGSSTIIKLKNSVTGANIDAIADNSAGALNRVTISNLKLDGNKANNASGTQKGILFSSVGSGTGSSATPGPKIEKVWVEQFRTYGIEFSSSPNGSITNTTVLANGTTTADRAVYLGSSSSYNTLSGNTVQGNTGIGIHMNAGSANNTVTGNTVQGNGASGIGLFSSTNTAAGNNLSGNAGHGFYVSGSQNSVSGNTISSSGENGIYLVSSSTDNIISGNRVATSGTVTATSSGIDLDNTANNNILSSNLITDTAGTGYAIALGISANSNYLADNTYSGTGASSIDDLSSTTIYGVQQTDTNFSLNLQTTATGAINIGSVGSSTIASTTNIANTSNATGAQVVTIGSSAANAGNITTIQGGSGATAININTASGGTLNVGNGGVANTIQIGNTTGAVAQTINIGNNATASSTANVTIGNLLSTSATTIQGGTGASAIALTQGSGGTITIGGTGGASTVNLRAGTGNVTVGTSDTTGTLLVLDTKTDAGDPTGVNGGSYYNSSTGKFRCYQASAWVDCVGAGAGSSTLQAAYDASSSQVTIQLTATDDNIIFQNPSSGGTDIAGAAVLKIDQLATGNVEGLRVESAGTGNLFTVRDTTATAADVFTLADGGAATFKNQTNSTAAFQIQNSSGSAVLTADTTNSRLTVVGDIYSKGTSWTSRTSAADNTWKSVAYGNGLFVAVAKSGSGNRVMTSPDGINWTTRTSAADNAWSSVTYGNGLFVAVACGVSATSCNATAGNRVMTSPDGINWTIRTSAADNQWEAVTYGNGLFVAVSVSGTGNRVMTSPDGINWTTRTSAADNNWYAVTYGNGLYVAIAYTGTGNRVMTSPDGINWTIRTSAADNTWSSVTYGNGLFVAVSQSGTGDRVMTSPDGITWTSRTSAADNTWMSVTYGNGLFVAVSDGGIGNRVMTSPDGINWTTRSSAADNNWYWVTYGNGLFVAVAYTGTGNRVMTSGKTELNALATNNIYQGGTTVYGNALFKSDANSSTSFQIQNSSGNNYLLVDTSGASVSLGNVGIASTIQIGNTTGAVAQTINIGNNATASSTTTVNIGSNIGSSPVNIKAGTGNVNIGSSDTTGTLFVLDTKTDAGDPTGANGGMYYNSNANKFRCYQNSGWTDCISASGATNLQGAYDGDADGSDAIIGLTAADGAIKIRDTSGGLGTDLFAIQNNGGTATYLGVSASAVTLQDASGNVGLLFDSTTSHLKIYEDGASPTDYVDIYYDSATSTAVFAASSGTTQIGSGSGGNINLTLTGTNDQILASKTNTPSAAYSINDFKFTRNLTGTSHALTGNVATIEDLSSFTSGSSSPNILYLNQNNTSATGNLLLAQTGGSTDKFKVTTAGDATLGGGVTIGSGSSYTGAGAVTLQSAAASSLTIDSGTTGALNIGTGANAKAITIGNATGATSTIVQAGTGDLTLKPITSDTTAFKLQDSGGQNFLLLDTTNDRLQVGDTTADATGVLLVLDTKNDTGDPTGVNGAMYYNSNAGKFRCYENGAWADCLGYRHLITLTSDSTSTASTACQTVTGASFPVTSGVTYRFQANLIHSASATTVGVAYGASTPTTTNFSLITTSILSTNALATFGTATASSCANPSASSVATSGSFDTVNGIITPSANGTFQLQFAPETATAGGSVIKAGSTLEWW